MRRRPAGRLGQASPHPANDTTGYICPRGQYCPEGSGVGTRCAAGYYSPSLGAFDVALCLACDAGRYCDESGLDAPAGVCHAGFYCSSTATTPRPANASQGGGMCPAGTYCPAGVSAPLYCEDGTLPTAPGSMICPSGYYCDHDVDVDTGVVTINAAVACPSGHYCLNGTRYATQYPCPSGTYNPDTASGSSTACVDCPAGEHCSGTGNAATAGTCDPGYYCPAASTSSQQHGCQLGYYCPAASGQPLACAERELMRTVAVNGHAHNSQ